MGLHAEPSLSLGRLLQANTHCDSQILTPAVTSPLGPGPESSGKLPVIHFTEIFNRHVKPVSKTVLLIPTHLQPALSPSSH